ncbi:hypothetical protein L228DRAFT_259955 [Xylona heveae TC161]|uniref:Uncharacterized protein n=1 Tax=Xylona heveae (strain CBS 132557 / TC161) TaxID=1328760 RepID=A0A165IER5_XYLHT|nr:hypothetical protein L228DRAFT_259955 [Xylona heveae TC161]KZF24790.1 hypothetical protein L228DRAFT_259955 [Xylona heveae TC161]
MEVMDICMHDVPFTAAAFSPFNNPNLNNSRSCQPVNPRKRAAESPEPESYSSSPLLESSPTPSILVQSRGLAAFKRSKTAPECPEALRLIPAERALPFDPSSLDDAEAEFVFNGRNVKGDWSYCRHVLGTPIPHWTSKSLLILCVVGSTDVHYKLLCHAQPELLRIAPFSHFAGISHVPRSDLAGYSAKDSSAMLPIPMIRARGPPEHHLLKLGLLHPLGGGQIGLDAVVVVDSRGRRRLVLPVGWGAGKYLDGYAGSKLIQEQFLTALKHAMSALLWEA